MFKNISLWQDFKRCAVASVSGFALLGFVWMSVATFSTPVPASLCSTSGTIFTTFTADLHC
ncbi:MAG TPA: hypothetical protein VGF14_06015 [Alphaproteobacteria bacterium]